jgi:hypothetical protein
MTDANAIRTLGTRFSLDFHGVRDLSEDVCSAIFHAMQAIEDRAAFVEAANSSGWLEMSCMAVMNAERHMRGED